MRRRRERRKSSQPRLIEREIRISSFELTPLLRKIDRILLRVPSLPYTDRFDQLVDEFNKTQGTPFLQHLV